MMVRVFLVTFDCKVDNFFDFIDKVQYDRVVLVVERVVALTKPDL